MTHRLLIPALLSPIIGLWLSGCVSQHTYNTARMEAKQLTQSLEAARTENQELEQEIAALHLRNKQEDAALSGVRTAIRQETDAAPMLRQRADDKLAALQTQIAYMMNQNRLLGREMAEAKQDRISLQAAVVQHKQEVDEASRSLLSPPAVTPAPLPGVTHRLAPAVPTPVPSTATAAAPAAAPPSLPANPPSVSRPATTPPAQSEESWTGKIKSWASSLWEWIFS